jgi:hypothetical protein
METFDLLFKIVGIFGIFGAAIVVLSLIIWQILKHLSVKWLDAKFNERLQELKHQHGKEIERLRFKISTLLDRATKLHQREFEVLPEAWFKLNDAFWNTQSCVSPVQTYPDLNEMSQLQLEEFISRCPLPEWQKSALLEEKDKNRPYQEYVDRYKFNDAHSKAVEAYTYTIKNGIFWPNDIQEKFTALHNLIWKALTDHKTIVKPNHLPDEIIRGLSLRLRQFSSEGENLMKELGGLVHERIWPADDTSLAKKL